MERKLLFLIKWRTSVNSDPRTDCRDVCLQNITFLSWNADDRSVSEDESRRKYRQCPRIIGKHCSYNMQGICWVCFPYYMRTVMTCYNGILLRQSVRLSTPLRRSFFPNTYVQVCAQKTPHITFTFAVHEALFLKFSVRVACRWRLSRAISLREHQ